jgi:hypothetical protein
MQEAMMRTAFIAAVCLALAGFWMADSPALGQQKTVKACRAEWQANRDIFEPKGITEQDYVDECRSFMAAPPATPATAGGNQFSTKAQAKARCRADIVVWANLSAKTYQFSGNKDYGNTKEGAYMCQKDATGQSFRASKTEKDEASNGSKVESKNRTSQEFDRVNQNKKRATDQRVGPVTSPDGVWNLPH